MQKDKGDTRAVFSAKAAVYNRRPEWPVQAFQAMMRDAGFDPDDRAAMEKLVVLDMGAGTGRTTTPVLDLGCTVIAAEPNPEMRRKLRQLQDRYGADRLIVTDGDAMNPKVPESFKGRIDLIFAGNSHHWWGSHYPGNSLKAEVRAVEAWRPLGHENTKTGVLFFRMKEDDPHVAELDRILRANFEKTRKSTFITHVTAPFEIESFYRYFNGTASPRETYFSEDFKIQDFEHFKEWLLSYSYVPGDAFDGPAAGTLKDFYDRLVEAGNGHASIKFGTRVYTGTLAQERRFASVPLTSLERPILSFIMPAPAPGGVAA